MFSAPVLQPELKNHLGIEWEARQSSGPIKTSYAGGVRDPITQAWTKIFDNINLKMNQDPFMCPDIGAFSALASINPDTKERSYAVSAYYAPVAHRPNLHVSLNSEVQQILLDSVSAGHRATRVQCKQGEQIVTVTARKEVILAAGTLQSPKLPELSGIGDSKRLKSYGVEVRINNKNVGENLQDHFFSAVGFEAQDTVPTLDSLLRQETEAIQAAMGQYMMTKDGPFSSVGVDACAYLPFVGSDPDSKSHLETLIPGNKSEAPSKLNKLYQNAMQQRFATENGPLGT